MSYFAMLFKKDDRASLSLPPVAEAAFADGLSCTSTRSEHPPARLALVRAPILCRGGQALTTLALPLAPLCSIWIQLWQEWTGIGAITAFAATVFRQAGYSDEKASLISGVNDIIYVFSVIIAVLIIDRIGRRKTLFVGSVGMATALILATVGSHYVGRTEGAERGRFGALTASAVVLYTAIFGQSTLLPLFFPPLQFPELTGPRLSSSRRDLVDGALALPHRDLPQLPSHQRIRVQRRRCVRSPALTLCAPAD